MSLLTDLNKRIEKKQDERWQVQMELDRLHAQAHALDAVIAELESFAKVVAKEESASPTPGTEKKLRAGSDVYKAREALRKLGKPSEIHDILITAGKPDNKDTRRSVTSQMAWYARKDQIFTRPEAGLWGLHEWAQNGHAVSTIIEAEKTALQLDPEDIEGRPAH